MHSWFRRIPYPALCALLGLCLGWVPAYFHGPIAYKFNVLGIRGAIAVWAYYSARLLIGYWVGVTSWPETWWLRGPLCGFLGMFPVTMISLATPGCGPWCMFWNLFTATAVGTVVAGLAWTLTGKHRL